MERTANTGCVVSMYVSAHHVGVDGHLVFVIEAASLQRMCYKLRSISMATMSPRGVSVG